MSVVNSVASWWMRKRMHRIEVFMKHPVDVQQDCLKELIDGGKGTAWGKSFGYSSINNYEQFVDRVPLQDYESLKAIITNIRNGQQNLLWNTETKWFAKSSGTAHDKSKYIPITNEALKACHFKAGKDMLAIYCSLYPAAQLFTGRYFSLAGSVATDKFGNYSSKNGDLSAIIAKNLPAWTLHYSTPSLDVLTMPNWEEKLEKIARSIVSEDVVNILGVPSWMLIVLKRVLEVSGKNSISQVWPNLEVYFHGGVNFLPYKQQFNEVIGKDINYLELFNASEGFFGIQDQRNSNELLLMLDYGIFYEFLAIDEIGTVDEKAIPLSEVKLGCVYAMVISTNAGLWRYKLGDTIRFTSLVPYRFVITGRTKNFINAFGEEVSVHNADAALHVATTKTGAQIAEYSAAPVYMQNNKSGAHEWLIEFAVEPNDINYFADVFDTALMSINSDYEAKRFQNYVLAPPIIRVLPKGTFYKWLASKNKLGGQQKVPRLSNNRRVVDEVLNLLGDN